MWQCEECKSWVPHRTLINKQIAGEYDTRWVCDECLKKHERELELTRQNFQAQFGEKPVQELSKPATDGTHHVVYERDSNPVDIHKIIDDAMGKKDRSVTMFINKDATTVSVYPYEDKPLEWLKADQPAFNYKCPTCGDEFRRQSPYCPTCGERLKFINIYN